MQMTKQKISTCLWFDNQAEEAAKFYVSIFKNSKILQTERYGPASAKASGRPEGSVMTVTFELDGEHFMGLNGGPVFTHSPAISFIVACDTQEEIDHFWEKLSEGGQVMECGWLTDKYGIAWQICPAELGEWMKQPGKGDRVMGALLTMKKLDLETLKNA
jgi:predicted 3-demethylubiquinone-9 3-methyltransferase (glyoxalase superfamily)